MKRSRLAQSAAILALVLTLVVPQAYARLYYVAYGDPGEDRALAVAPLSDGGQVVTGRRQGAGDDGAQLWVAELTATGSPRWQRLLGASDAEEGRSVAVDAQGEVVAVGVRTPAGAGPSEVLVARFDGLGTLVKSVAMGGSESVEAEAVAILPDGDVVVAGHIEEGPGSAERDAWVARFAPDLSLRWQRRVALPDDERARAVALLPGDGGPGAPDIVLAGDSVAGARSDLLVLRLDPLGESVLDARTWTASEDDRGRALRRTASGGLAVAGSALDAAGAEREAWLVLLDADLELVSSRTYDAGGSLEGEALAVAAGSGELLLAGRWRTGSQDEAFALRLNSAGEPLGQRAYGDAAGGDAVLAAAFQEDCEGGASWLLAGETAFGAGAEDALAARVGRLLAIDSGCTLERALTVGSTAALPSDDVLAPALATPELTSSEGPAVTPLAHAPSEACRSVPCEVSSATAIGRGQEALTLGKLGVDEIGCEWMPASELGAGSFNMYEGKAASLPGGSYGECARSGITSNSSICADLFDVDPGQAMTVLVTAVNRFAGEGPLGVRSDGLPRENTAPCP